ncbi:MAG: hypothetical protein K2Q22_17135 [Cytophagales bacterium]|nr:hypothetical protein [Cytophagales bacterium]
MTFPQYRKLANKSYYKIISPTEMIEIQRLGKRVLTNHLQANSFLDRNLIADLLDGDGGRYVVISEEEFEGVLSTRY